MAPHAHVDYEGNDFLQTVHNDTYPAVDPTQWDLAGRMVVVTGASRGIGRSIAVSFTKAGVSGIALLARSANTLDETEAAILSALDKFRGGKTKPKVLKVVVDVTDEKAVADAESQVRSHFGRVDIVINNAGYGGGMQPITESDPVDWWKTWEVNIKGPYLVTRAFLPLLIESEGGIKTIVNVASNSAFLTWPGGSAYMPGKLALVRFTEFIAAEYGPKGVLAISVHPGSIKTDMAAALPQEFHVLMNDTPELAADSIVWLTKERREWLQGRYVDCGWDTTDLEAKKDEIVREDKLKFTLII